MDRRTFFRTARGMRPATLDVSCEQLYMRYLDGELRGTTERLFARLERDLARAHLVRLRGQVWLARDETFRRALETRLAQFEARGGRIERLS
jgi:hypothetical protein